MKRSAITVFCVLCAVVACNCPAQDILLHNRVLAPIDTYLLFGQSNMVGKKNSTNDLGALASQQTNVLFTVWTHPSDGVSYRGAIDGDIMRTLAPLAKPWITTANGVYFGLELSMAQTLSQGNPMWVYKVASGGTDLAYDWNPDPEAQASTNTFRHCWTWARDLWGGCCQAIAARYGYEPIVRGVIWYQGENDSMKESYAGAYENNLTNLIANIRSTFGCPTQKVVIVRIKADYAGDYITTVRAAQTNVAETLENCAWVSVDDYTTNDGTHLDDASLTNLGNRVAEEFQ